MTDPKQPSPTPPPGAADRQALLAAYKDVVREQEQKQSERPIPESPPSRLPFWIVMGTLTLALAGILVLRPAWLFPRREPETPAMIEASLRMRIYVEIERVERFRAREGRIPASLIEAGGDSTGLTYAANGGGYAITGHNMGLGLTYRSGMPPREFLGNSDAVLRRRRTP